MNERKRNRKQRGKIKNGDAPAENKHVREEADGSKQAKEDKGTLTHREAGKIPPHRGLWELEIEEAEKKEYDRMHGGPGGRPLFNGRPIRSVVEKLESIFKIGGGPTQAYSYAEIDKGTYYDFIKDKPNLANRFEALQESQVIVALNTVTKAAQTNPSIAMAIIDRKIHKTLGQGGVKVDVNVNTATFSVNAQLMALKAEFDRRFLEELNKADIAGHIPPESDTYQIPAPPELLNPVKEDAAAGQRSQDESVITQPSEKQDMSKNIL